jgi:hypothetical protein
MDLMNDMGFSQQLLGPQGYGQGAAPQLELLATKLAAQAPPPSPGTLMQILGQLRGFGDERQKIQAAAMGRHYVSPPVMGGGAQPQPMMGALFQQAAKSRGRPPLGASLLGGGGGR